MPTPRGHVATRVRHADEACAWHPARFLLAPICFPPAFPRQPPRTRIALRMTLEAQSARTASDQLRELVGRREAQRGSADLGAGLEAGQGAPLGGAWGSGCALVAASLTAHAPATLVVVCPHGSDVD